MSATRTAALLGAAPILVGILYLLLQQGAEASVADSAGGLLLLALGASMAFGFLVILRGARDL